MTSRLGRSTLPTLYVRLPHIDGGAGLQKRKQSEDAGNLSRQGRSHIRHRPPLWTATACLEGSIYPFLSRMCHFCVDAPSSGTPYIPQQTHLHVPSCFEPASIFNVSLPKLGGSAASGAAGKDRPVPLSLHPPKQPHQEPWRPPPAERGRSRRIRIRHVKEGEAGRRKISAVLARGCMHAKAAVRRGLRIRKKNSTWFEGADVADEKPSRAGKEGERGPVMVLLFHTALCPPPSAGQVLAARAQVRLKSTRVVWCRSSELAGPRGGRAYHVVHNSQDWRCGEAQRAGGESGTLLFGAGIGASGRRRYRTYMYG